MLFKFLLIASLAICSAFAQGDIDPTFCNLVPVPNPPSPPKLADKTRYSVEIERNAAYEKFTEEIREYYDSNNDVGISINRFAGQTVKTISYYKTDELLIVKGYSCLRQSLKENYQATPFFLVTDSNGTEHISTGINLLNRLGANIVYQGESETRGIPVRQWGACVFDQKRKATLKMIFQYSNSEKWTPANAQDSNNTIPVQLSVDIKFKDTGAITSVVDFFTRFRINNQIINEEIYFTDPGVYCPERISVKPYPKIPEKFSSWVQQSAPSPSSILDYLEGSLRTWRIEHDFPRKLYRVDYYDSNDRFTEIHDYTTGLKYKMNRYKRTCELNTIEDINSDTEPQSSATLFETTQDPAYQYTGMRIVRGMNTDVWIAPRKYNGNDGIWEWHFMTDQWISQETNAVKTNEPVLLSIYLPVTGDSNNKYRIQFHFTQFDQSRIDLYDYDISMCGENIANKHISFTITTDYYETFKYHQAPFKDSLMEAIQKYGNIGLIRIGKLQTIYENKQIYAVMTLFERPNKYGPVLAPPQENNLEGAYQTLKNTINNGNFKFSTIIDFNTTITVTADKESLTDLQDNNGRFYLVAVDTEQTIGYTSGAVVGFVIGFLIVGLSIGFVSAYFLVIKRSGPIQIPGFLNPNFKADSKA